MSLQSENSVISAVMEDEGEPFEEMLFEKSKFDEITWCSLE